MRKVDTRRKQIFINLKTFKIHSVAAKISRERVRYPWNDIPKFYIFSWPVIKNYCVALQKLLRKPWLFISNKHDQLYLIKNSMFIFTNCI